MVGVWWGYGGGGVMGVCSGGGVMGFGRWRRLVAVAGGGGGRSVNGQSNLVIVVTVSMRSSCNSGQSRASLQYS